MDVYTLQKDKVPQQEFFKKRQDGDFLVVLSPNMCIFYLNEVATFIYNQIDGSRSIEEIKKIVLEEFDIAQAQLEDELLTSLRDMEKKQILSFVVKQG
jgi:methyltransferase-like protein